MRMPFALIHSAGFHARRVRRKFPLLLAIPLLGILSSASARIIHVDGGLDTDPIPDGMRWATAFATVQEGIDAAEGGDEIWVAEGIYEEHIALKEGVRLYGGFSGDETMLAERDPDNRRTVLDGMGTGRVILVEEGATEATRIDGFRIWNGSATDGAGVYCTNASPRIENNWFENNEAGIYGGAIHIGGGAPGIVNNEFRYNTAVLGGAVACIGSTALISSNRFLANSARGGGGIHSLESSPTVSFNQLFANSARDFGGGIECLNSSGQYMNNRLIGNFCRDEGVGPGRGAGMNIWGPGDPMVANNLIVGNHMESGRRGPGGGIYCEARSEARLVSNTLIYNSSDTGGGVFCESNRVVLANNLIASNTTGLYAIEGTVLRNNCIVGNGTRDYTGLPDQTGLNGNISQAPGLAPDIHSPGFQLSADSPCRDAGDASFVQAGWLDIEGQERVAGETVDIGADEFTGTNLPQPDQIIRVKPDGDDDLDGSSWDAAMGTLQAAIDEAFLTGGEVWVRGGDYQERITVRRYVRLYGGFGGNEAVRDERDTKANPTRIDGEKEGTVVNFQGTGTTSGIDGFIIQNGSHWTGGGIGCYSSSPRIENNRITENVATEEGGGVFCDQYSNPDILRNRIERNVAAGSGGGIQVSGAASPVIANNLIERNVLMNLTGNTTSVTGGGGIHCGSYSKARIINNTFLLNQGTQFSSPGTRVEKGGGIYSDSVEVKIANNLFVLNSSVVAKPFSSPLDFHHNCEYASLNSTSTYVGGPQMTGIDGNLSDDPRIGGTGDIRLRAESICRDAGDASVVDAAWLDLDGEPRVQGLSVDIGAHEFRGAVPEEPRWIVRVAEDGDDANDGVSWENAKRTVQAGVEAAFQEGGEIWVKAGVYHGPVEVRAFTHLYGGFAGHEQSRAERDWVANESILDGGHTNGVVRFLAVGSYATVSGFTIRNGKQPRGGGIESWHSPTIEYNRIINNHSDFGLAGFTGGGGIYSRGGKPVIANNLIAGNRSTVSGSFGVAPGGGVYLAQASEELLLANNTIIGNTAGKGGNVYIEDGQGRLVNNIIALGSSGIENSGGSIFLDRNCVFGNENGDYVGLEPSGTDLRIDPLFLDVPGGDYRLLPDSPVIDAGTDGVVEPGWTDLDGEARVQGDAIDIGAFETVNSEVWEPVTLDANHYSLQTTNVGGLTYGWIQVTLPDSCHRLVNQGPVTGSGPRFLGDLKVLRLVSGTCETPGASTVKPFVFGRLGPGDFAFDLHSFGEIVFSEMFAAEASDARTLTDPRRESDGSFSLSLHGLPGITYQIEVAGELPDWSPLTLVELEDYEQRLIDPGAASHPIRYYRARIF